MGRLLPTLELLFAALRALTACVPLFLLYAESLDCGLIDWLVCVVVVVYHSGRYSIGGMSSRLLSFPLTSKAHVSLCCDSCLYVPCLVFLLLLQHSAPLLNDDRLF
jgi:hypothetical protein